MFISRQERKLKLRKTKIKDKIRKKKKMNETKGPLRKYKRICAALLRLIDFLPCSELYIHHISNTTPDR